MSEKILQMTPPISRSNYSAKKDILKMNNYVTKEQLEISELQQKILISELEKNLSLNIKGLDGKLDNMNDKIDSLSTNIPLLVEKKLNDNEKENRKNHTETIKFVWGTIILGIISILVSLIH
ncbi:DUF2730 family protein [Leuconostoc gasicomitatum]|uniref:DUF2730 family protein n=1 Tax=Leuconostoc gasicomitatum TaxID=115778 RepID=UPI000B7C593E|nr:DUF2730 family protein [Leuconostoc gasicomitatum]